MNVQEVQCHPSKWFGVWTWRIKFQIRKGFWIRKVHIQIWPSRVPNVLNTSSLAQFLWLTFKLCNQSNPQSLNESRIFLKSHAQAVCWNNPLFPMLNQLLSNSSTSPLQIIQFHFQIMSAFYFHLKTNQNILKSHAQARWLLIPSESPLPLQILFPSLQMFSHHQK